MTDLVVQRRGRGRPLVLLHGATLDHRMWQPQVAALADRFEVVTYDLRGFGQSPAPVGPFKHCEDASALLDELGLRDAVVIGHSIGAFYALELALLRPDAVTGLVSVCMSGLIPDYPKDIQSMFDELKRLSRGGDLAAAKALWSRCGWFTSARAMPGVAALLDDCLASYSGWYWQHDTPATKLDPPAAARLDELAMPTLVIDGALDLDYNHAIADQLVARIPGAELMRLEVGHMASLEDPDAITSAIARLAAG
ncbi:MAG: alpha/beta fold hydrolase [Deltaproteobacteria bacterium]|nr:alpha/beta fold hydrolase [Deltaproteobacteria bacterium]